MDNGKKVKILWLDDNANYTEGMSELMFKNEEVVRVAKVDEARQYLQKEVPDIFLTDIWFKRDEFTSEESKLNEIIQLMNELGEKNPRCVRAIVTAAGQLPKIEGIEAFKKSNDFDKMQEFIREKIEVAKKQRIKSQMRIKRQPKIPQSAVSELKKSVLSHPEIIARQKGIRRPLTVEEARRQIAAEIQAGPGYGDKRLMKYLFPQPQKPNGRKIPRARVK